MRRAACISPCGVRHLLASFVALWLAAAPTHGQCQYEVTVIQAPPCPFPFNDPPPTIGTGINELGHVVGYYYHCGGAEGFEAFLYTPETGLVTLDRPADVLSAGAADLNDAGVIVGTYERAGVQSRAFVYESGVFTELAPEPPGLWSQGAAINNAGQAVGYRSIGDGINPYNAFTWSAAGGFTDLGVMNGPYSSGSDVNEAGQVVGWTGILGAPAQEAFLWQGGELTLLGPIPGGIASWANAVNNRGTLTGGGIMDPLKFPDTVAQPAVWQNGNWVLLGLLPGCDIGGSRDINDVAMVVGLCNGPDTPRRGFLWQNGFSGDLVGDDDPVLVNNDDNSFNVVWNAFATQPTAVLNGFTIRGGNADGTSGFGDDHNGGGIFNHGDPVIVNCTITGNTATFGGGVWCEPFASPAFINCIITDNEAVENTPIGGNGGGLGRGQLGGFASTGALTLVNCLIARNTAANDGAGLFLVGGEGTTIINCTIANNVAGSRGGGYFEAGQFSFNSLSTIDNSIFSRNGAPQGPQIFLDAGVDMTIDFSDVDGGEGGIGCNLCDLSYGANNIDAPPLFEDQAGGNYRLTCASPCRSTGDNGLAPDDEADVDDDGNTMEKTRDHDLNHRIIRTTVDMGSFEAHSDCPPGDCAGGGPDLDEPDGTVNIFDLIIILQAFDLPGGPCDVFPECSGDGIVDIQDLNLVRANFGEQCGGIPASSGGGWEEEPWVYDLLAEFGFDVWDEFAVWVPEADLDELQAFLEALIGALDS